MNYFLLLTIIVATALVFLPSPKKRKKTMAKPEHLTNESIQSSEFETPVGHTIMARDEIEAEVNA